MGSGNTGCLEKRPQVCVSVSVVEGGWAGHVQLINHLLPGGGKPCHKRLECVVVYRDKCKDLSII